ncbi:MAG TPA: hypothetical protein VKB90_00665 [Candidatus Acidoferrum sp.]|nr:hypothetical protein [Candidatus Acidoferrum sp.]
MKSSPRLFVVSVFASLIAAAAAAQAPAPQQAQPVPQPGAVSPGVWSKPAGQQPQASPAFQSACGSQPLCYDAQDFAVAVVDFRMSITNGVKMMDATLRFVNKTAQPLILGYVDGSAVALDDQGNRYGTYYNKGLAGIGLVSGMNADPKFVIQPGGGSDARFELMWRPGQQDAIGSTFELDLTIRGINTLVGGQHTLGEEVPLRFQGLANGMTGAGLASSGAGANGPAVAGGPGVATAAPQAAAATFANGGGATAAAPVCGPNGSAGGKMNAIAGAANSVGGQQTANATSTASNTASNAATALSNLKSIFGKKNANAAAATNSAATAPVGSPCVPPTAASPTAASAAPGSAAAPSAAAAVSTGAKPAGAAAPATAPVAGAAKNGAAPPAAAIRAGKPIVNAPAAQAPAAASPAAKPSTAPAAAKPATPPAANTAKKPAPATNKANTPADPNKPSQR